MSISHLIIAGGSVTTVVITTTFHMNKNVKINVISKYDRNITIESK